MLPANILLIGMEKPIEAKKKGFNIVLTAGA
jgi:hypothetical protein